MISDSLVLRIITFVYYFTTDERENKMKKDTTLFHEFSAITTQQWKEKITKDLKGKPYEKLIRKTPEGFEIKPFYREEDLANISYINSLPGEFPFIRGNNTTKNNWLVRQDILVNDIGAANAKALDVRLRGVDSLGFIFPEESKQEEQDLEKLVENIRADIMELNFSGGDALTIVNSVDALAKKYNRNLSKVKGSVNYDPLGEYSVNGNFRKNEKEDFEKLLSLFETGKHLPGFQLITINAHLFHNSGGGIVSELAYALAMGAEYLTYLTDNGLSVDDVAPKIRFHFAIGSEYFMEIAKFRAFKFLWAKVVNAYGLNNANNAATHIHASNSLWNKTVYDPYVNMLRTTTETMSALIGGIDSLSVMPFDATYNTPDDFSERFARNQQLILKEESYFDKVTDPAAGSYYIENLTNELIHYAWELFLETDAKGGYLKGFQKGDIQNRITKEADEKDRNIALRKHSVLGINQYPNITEHLEQLTTELVLYPKKQTSTEAEPLVLYRGAMAFEQLRYQTDQHSLNSPRPKVWMFTYGNLAMRRARSQFAGNFFGVAGYEIIDNPGFEKVADGVAAANKSNANIVVLCASDNDYETLALDAFQKLNKDFIVVLAGYPSNIADELKAAGMENFIHVKSNVLEELKRYQKMLGIKNHY